jgi:enamine deaminase RidA (YjgF/YER057c/UK114 family)
VIRRRLALYVRWIERRGGAGVRRAVAPREIVRPNGRTTSMTISIEALGTQPQLSFSQAVLAGDTLYVSGQIAIGADGRLVGADDPGRQAQQCFDNLEAVLRDAGMGLDAVVKLTCFMVSAADYAAYRDVKVARLPRTTPASTGIVVTALLVEGARFEVEAVAVRRDGG